MHRPVAKDRPWSNMYGWERPRLKRLFVSKAAKWMTKPYRLTTVRAPQLAATCIFFTPFFSAVYNQ